MQLPDSFLAAVSDYILRHKRVVSNFNWQVTKSAWQELRTGFPYEKYGNDLYSRHVALKWHLAEHWSRSDFDEKVRIAQWLVKEWGGIKRNRPETILGYVNQADAFRPATPFAGVASYSKILSIKDPAKFAIFDARVSIALNAIQLVMLRDGAIPSHSLLLFNMPPGQNRSVAKFAKAARRERLLKYGFRLVERDSTYSTYLAVLLAVTGIAGAPSLLDAEMILFVRAERLSEEALPLVQ